MGMALETLGETTARRDKVTILYKSNMSYVQLVKYLDNLMDMGFAEKIKEPHRAYGITTNGKLFMDLVKGNGHDGSPTK